MAKDSTVPPMGGGEGECMMAKDSTILPEEGQLVFYD